VLEQLKTQNELDFYKSYIGKNVSIYNKQYKVIDVRRLDERTILMYYEIKINETGIINSMIVKDIKQEKFLDEMEKEK